MTTYQFKTCVNFNDGDGGELHGQTRFETMRRSYAIRHAVHWADSFLHRHGNPFETSYISCFTLFKMRRGKSGEMQYDPDGVIALKPKSREEWEGERDRMMHEIDPPRPL